MTKFTAITLLAVLAATPALAQNVGGDTRTDRGGVNQTGFTSDEDGGDHQRPQTRHTRTRSLTLVDARTGDPLAMTPTEASNHADEVCGGDSILYFDIDENGDPVESSYNFDCMDDL